jgi:alpha-mannosidase
MFFIDEKLDRRMEEIKTYIYRDSETIKNYRIKQGNFKDGDAVNLDDSDWTPFNTDELWGGYDQYFWFRGTIQVPERFAGEKVAFHLVSETDIIWKKAAEYLAYLDGEPVQGLDIFHHELLLAEKARGDETFRIALKGFSGLSPEQVKTSTRLVVIDQDTEQLYYNIKIAYDVAMELDSSSEDYYMILNHLDRAVNLVDLRRQACKEFYASAKVANQYLLDNLYAKQGKSEVVMNAVGHTHIDIAWLWQLSHTREKCSRSFSTAINLMEQYPSYKFIQTQPQLYDYVKEDFPKIYEKIKQKIKEGRWEAEGGMWVEADCNVISGESMVRQFLFGKRFFSQEFDVNSEILWLPDVFGYSAAMPQILKKCGINYFMTTKLSWNQFNNLPMDTFYLTGIDGSQVLTHFITTPELRKANLKKGVPFKKTYNGLMIPKAVIDSWKHYKNKDINNELLMAYGWGDGGGGPTKEMLENANRLESFPGSPSVKQEFALEFFRKLEKTLETTTKVKEWVGELYLELHRGTYTSMARNKKMNRMSEFLYLAAETLSVVELLLGGSYQQEKLNAGWKLILLNQFHDIIPGSSIKEVYDDSWIQYDEIIQKGTDVWAGAISAITRHISLQKDAIIVFNQLSNKHSGLVYVDITGKRSFIIVDIEGNPIPYQVLQEGSKAVFFGKAIPAKGYQTYYVEYADRVEYADATGNNDPVDASIVPINEDTCSTIVVEHNQMENQFFKLLLDEQGNFTSIYDKRNEREVLKPGERGNVLQAFEDKPINFNAWDIDIFYEEKMWEVNEVSSIQVLDRGPLVGRLRIEKTFLDSTIIQDITIYKDVPRIDFVTNVDWKQQEILLKAAFPVDINASKATYEIQYGNIERNTHRNTSWDLAKFEVVGHKWADLSEGGYGVSLMNDCKYGYDIHGSQMRLTLLKSGIYPNPVADQEQHEFTYSLYPHQGGWREANTVDMAYSLNCPLTATMESQHEGILPEALSIIELDKSNVIIDCIKKAEDSDDIIVRLYEAYNWRSRVSMKFFGEFDAAVECDMLENEEQSVEVIEGIVTFEMKPFEIKTIKIKNPRLTSRQ